jgi:hypothetical protein
VFRSQEGGKMQRPDSHEKTSSKKRTPARLSAKLEKSLWAYAAAASAAGVGLLASAQAARAEVVYTPVNAKIQDSFALDLNHDGVVDFNLIRWGAASIAGSTRFSYVNVCHDAFVDFSHQCVSSTFDANADNLVLAAGGDAAALLPGAKIGNGQPFIGTGVRVYMGGRRFYSLSNTAQKWNGPWVNGGAGVANRYLGLKFKIDGEYHYGWARLTFKTTPHEGFTAILTGYAYETTANKGILAGQTTETGDFSAVTPTGPITGANAGYHAASLGLLALGAAGLSIWRREEIDHIEATTSAAN